MPRLYAAKFGLQCGLSWESIWWVTCTNACTQRSALNYQNKISECWPFFVEDIYILLIISCHFAGSVSTTGNTNCPYHRPYVKHIRKKDTSRLKLSWCRIELSLTVRYSILSNLKKC